MSTCSEGSAYPQPALDTPPDQRVAPQQGDAATDRGDSPDELWAALAPLIAGRPVVRLAVWNGRQGRWAYPRSAQRPLTTRLPAQQAAVPIYNEHGQTKTIVFDLDVSAAGGIDQVGHDLDVLREIVARAGGRIVTDHSPTGGVHGYLPLTAPVPFHDARNLTRALRTRLPSLDPQPMNGLTDGVIRPPGALHKSGGHQKLHGTLADAAAILRAGNPPVVWRALTTDLAAEIAALDQPTTPDHAAPDTADSGRASGARNLSAGPLRIATTGLYDTTKYRSPSEARQAVMTAAAWAGLSLPQILQRLETGTWPGLAALYARRKPGGQHGRAWLITHEWHVATRSVETAKNNPQKHVRNSPTSQPPTRRAATRPLRTNTNRDDESRHIRTWLNAVLLAEKDQRWTGRSATGLKMVLRALGAAAMKTGSAAIEFGVRSLSIDAGQDHTTLAAHLRTLRSEDDPFIDLVRVAHGLDADLYQLRVPDRYADRARWKTWRAGRIHALRPAFRELGATTALVYEVLEHRRGLLRSIDIVTETQLARSTVHDGLLSLAAWNLAVQTNGGWRLTTAAAETLLQLAELFGAADDIARQIRRHRSEREGWRRRLRVVVLLQTAVLHPDDLPPPEILESAVEAVEALLGGRVIRAG